MKKNPAFDGIRGFAFLLVFGIHYFTIYYEEVFPYIQGCGKYGVWLFFVLSSFLLTRNYVIPNESKVEYAVGRLFKILPLYIIAIMTYWYFGHLSLTKLDWLKLPIGQYGPMHFWTIPVEFTFYGILLLIWAIPNSIGRTLTFTTCSLVSLAAISFINKEPNSMNVLWYLPSFLCGYFLALLDAKLKEEKFPMVIPLLILMVFIMLVPGIRYMMFGISPSPYLTNMFFPLSLLWSIFILTIIKTSSESAYKIFASSPLIFLGKISYSGYLFHWIIIVEIKTHLGSGVASMLMSVFLTIVISWIISSYIEIPIYRFRKIIVGEHFSEKSIVSN